MDQWSDNPSGWRRTGCLGFRYYIVIVNIIMKENEAYNHILNALPYSKPFLFVDELIDMKEDGIVGSYTYPEDSDFYKGHFKDNPVTPGVILTETMAQIGVVCLGIHLINQEKEKKQFLQIAMTSSSIDYLLPVYPGEKVIVNSKKVYFRFGKLKCEVEMLNTRDEVVCKGTISGMMKSGKAEPKPNK